MKLARALASVGDADLVSCADLDEGAALRTAREFGFSATTRTTARCWPRRS